MNSLRLSTWTGLGLAAVAALSLFAGGSPAARAATGASGSLVRGGVAAGDISLDAGDEDRVTIDLVQGSAFTAKFSSTFTADVTFVGPDSMPVDLAWGTGPKRAVKAWTVAQTGRHEFRIRSSKGQGTWTLAASAKWPKKVSLSGTSGGGVTWTMPAGASVSGKVAAFPAKSFDPQIDSVQGPSGGSILPAPVTGAKGFAVLPKLTVNADGACDMTVSGGAGGGQYRASLVLTVPKTAPAKLALANGLTTVSYAADGVKDVIVAKCAACHAWTASATAFKPHAKQGLAMIVAGSMPQGGARLPQAEIDLIRGWIDTGMKP